MLTSGLRPSLKTMRRGASCFLTVTMMFGWPPAARAQTIDPLGQLTALETDVLVSAGSIALDVRRTYEPDRNVQGLLGKRWRLNWESQILETDAGMVIIEGGAVLPLVPAGSSTEFRAPAGDRVVVDRGGRAVRSKTDGTQEVYSPSGKMLERLDRNGNRVTLKYDPADQLSRIEGPYGSHLDLLVDRAGRVTRIEASNGDAVTYGFNDGELTSVSSTRVPPVSYTYDQAGRLAQAQTRGSGPMRYQYDTDGRVTRLIWADGAEERYDYENSGLLIRRTDAGGGVTVTQRDAIGGSEEVTDPLGNKTRTQFDDRGRVSRTTGPDGTQTRGYDGLGRLITIEDATGAGRFTYVKDTPFVASTSEPGGAQTTYEYDSQLNLTAIKRNGQLVMATTYYPNGLVKSVREAGGTERVFTYDTQGRLQTVTTGSGAKTQYEHDSRGNMIRVISAVGGETRWTYDAMGRRVSETAPNGGTKRWEYDAAGQLAEVVEPAGGHTRFEYDARGRRVAIIDAGGRRETLAIATDGRSSTWQRPDGVRVQMRVDPNGRLIEEVDAAGRSASFTYDAAGHTIGQRTPEGRKIGYEYDAAGRLVGVHDGLGGRTRYTWDPSGELASVTTASGATVRYQYDENGRAKATIDPLGNRVRFTTDAAGRIVQATTAAGDTATAEYDAEGRMSAIRYPSGVTMQFGYDAINNLVIVNGPGKRQVRHTYDAAGQLVTTTDATGVASRLTYDAAGRVISRQSVGGKLVRFTYGPLGELASADDGEFPLTNTYDKGGRLSAVSYPALRKSVRYEGNAAGLRTQLMTTDGRSIGYSYDKLGRLERLLLPDKSAFTFSYDSAGRLATMNYPNGIAGAWDYDAEGRVKSVSYKDARGQGRGSWTCQYDLANNPVRIERSGAAPVEYSYDADHRLTTETVGGNTVSYIYKSGGDRAKRVSDAQGVEYRYDEAGHIAQAGSEQFLHDAAGRLTARKRMLASCSYSYDSDDQLVSVKKANGDQIVFGYAPTGQRAWRKNKDGTTRFIYDGLNLLEELDDTGRTTALYVHGPGVDRPLATVRDGKTYCYHLDPLGNVAMLTDPAGKPAVTYEMDAFGNLTLQSGEFPNPFIFAGREYEPELGLYYFRARYYAPSLGRFITPDLAPISLDDPVALNSYVYVGNNPTLYRDPLGASRIAGAGNSAKSPLLSGGASSFKPPPSYFQMFMDEFSEAVKSKGLPGGAPSPVGTGPVLSWQDKLHKFVVGSAPLPAGLPWKELLSKDVVKFGKIGGTKLGVLQGLEGFSEAYADARSKGEGQLHAIWEGTKEGTVKGGKGLVVGAVGGAVGQVIMNGIYTTSFGVVANVIAVPAAMAGAALAGWELGHSIKRIWNPKDNSKVAEHAAEQAKHAASKAEDELTKSLSPTNPKLVDSLIRVRTARIPALQARAAKIDADVAALGKQVAENTEAQWKLIDWTEPSSPFEFKTSSDAPIYPGDSPGYLGLTEYNRQASEGLAKMKAVAEATRDVAIDVVKALTTDAEPPESSAAIEAAGRTTANIAAIGAPGMGLASIEFAKGMKGFKQGVKGLKAADTADRENAKVISSYDKGTSGMQTLAMQIEQDIKTLENEKEIALEMLTGLRGSVDPMLLQTIDPLIAQIKGVTYKRTDAPKIIADARAIVGQSEKLVSKARDVMDKNFRDTRGLKQGPPFNKTSGDEPLDDGAVNALYADAKNAAKMFGDALTSIETASNQRARTVQEWLSSADKVLKSIDDKTKDAQKKNDGAAIQKLNEIKTRVETRNQQDKKEKAAIIQVQQESGKAGAAAKEGLLGISKD